MPTKKFEGLLAKGNKAALQKYAADATRCLDLQQRSKRELINELEIAVDKLAGSVVAQGEIIAAISNLLTMNELKGNA
jgi:hypothetical protein